MDTDDLPELAIFVVIIIIALAVLFEVNNFIPGIFSAVVSGAIGILLAIFGVGITIVIVISLGKRR